MSLPFERDLNNPIVMRIMRVLFYVLIAGSALVLFLFFREREGLKKVQAKLVILNNLESEVDALLSQDVSTIEEERVRIASGKQVFPSWYEFANWLEVLRLEAAKREIDFRYSFTDKPVVSGSLTSVNCIFSLSSAKEGYARYLSFLSFVCDIREYQIVLQNISFVRGESEGIKEAIFTVNCWIIR